MRQPIYPLVKDDDLQKMPDETDSGTIEEISAKI